MCVNGVELGSIEFRAEFFLLFFLLLRLARHLLSTLSSCLEYDTDECAARVDIHIVIDRRVASLDADAIQSALARIFAHVVGCAPRANRDAVRWSVAGGATMQSVFDVAAWYKFCASLSSVDRRRRRQCRTSTGRPLCSAVADVIQALSNEALVGDDSLANRRAIVVVVAPLPGDIDCVDADAVQDEIDEPLKRLNLSALCESANARVLFVSFI
jgi:hypothetical protein